MFDFLISTASAQDAAAKAQPNMFASFAPFAIIFVIFYFLMIRPQKKRLEQEKALLGGLTKGDEIFTKSGMIGTITGITEKIITLEVSDGVKLKVLREQIGGLASMIFDSKNSKK